MPRFWVRFPYREKVRHALRRANGFHIPAKLSMPDDGFYRPPPSSEFSWCPSLAALPPPPPFPVQPCVSHHPPYERESSFVGMLIRVPLAPAFLVASDAGLRPCPPPPLPTPWPSSSGSGSALGLVAVIGRSVGTPRHGRGHGPDYRGCYPRGQTYMYLNMPW